MKLADYNGHLVTLCLMATGTFAIGTDAFIVAGVLSDISATFAVSPAQAGQLISIFALAYMLFAPSPPGCSATSTASISCSWRWCCSSPAT
ncbi:hypothetical protein QEP77_13485 [Serratia sp. B1]|nr:hypothetical protein QEP77_13485 [Serratia sp. B1]